MKITLLRETFLNAIKAVRGIVNSRANQPILASVLVETNGENKIKLVATDLVLSMSYTIEAKVEKEGKFAINGRMFEDIITKIPDGKEVTLELSPDDNLIKINSGKIKYEVVSLDGEEFPDVFNKTKRTADDNIEPKEFQISSKDFNRGIKQTVFSAVQNDVGGVLTGVCFTISDNTLEMVATDGNRLTRSRIPINSKGEDITFICSYRTLNEISKLINTAGDKDDVKFTIKGSKIVFEFSGIIFQSGLIDGTYPKYQQLIPTTNEKVAIIDREEFINTIDRVSVMVNSRTNIMKFNFEESVLDISTDTPDAGSAKERTDIEYNSDSLLIAFNYKYILDCLRNMSGKKVRVEMSTNLSASVIKPDNNNEEQDSDNYLCLIMPVQVR